MQLGLHRATSHPPHDAAYTEIRHNHFMHEHKHGSLRSQYRIGPDCLALRPRKSGAAVHRSRCAAVMLVEWLRFVLRAGLRGARFRLGKSGVIGDAGMRERLLQLRASPVLAA